MKRKFQLLTGHKVDMWFIQELSHKTKRYEITDVFYDQELAEISLKELQKKHKV